MKQKVIISIIIGLMCFILIYVMGVQIRTIEKTDITSIKTMREAELKTEMANWKTKYEEIVLKYEDLLLRIEEYKEAIEEDSEATDLINKEIAQANLLLGQTNVQGSGVIVILANTEEGQIDDLDLLMLINELRMAGAESISINEERIINISEIRTAGYHILVNDQKTTSPYTIKAIGDPSYLESQLIIKDGYIDNIKKAGIDASVEKQDNVRIPKYYKQINFKYAV